MVEIPIPMVVSHSVCVNFTLLLNEVIELELNNGNSTFKIIQ